MEIFKGNSMKKSTYYIVEPMLMNDVRKDVIKWCEDTFGPKHRGEKGIWHDTGNYTRSTEAEFDLIFSNKKHAHWFNLKFGGNIRVHKI